MDYKVLAEQLVKKCSDKGADAAEVYLETNRDLDISIRNGELETIQESSAAGIGFRVFVKGKMAFTHCNDLSDSSLDSTIEQAVTLAKYMTEDENNVLPSDMSITEVEGLYDPEIAKVSMDDKIALVKKAEELALQDSRITKGGGSRYGENEGVNIIANTHGLLKEAKFSACYYGTYVVAEKGDQKSTGAEYCTRRFYSDLVTPEEIAVEASRKAYEMLDPRMVRTQKAAVIFDPSVARALLGGILGAVNGERVLQNASFLVGKTGEKIGSDIMTLVDDGIRPKGLASQPFDGEGVATRKRKIVDKGVLQGYMYNTIVAKRAGVESTGNASRRGFTSLPGIGSHNFYMEAGNSTPEQIIRNTKNGLFLNSVTGYGINPVSGNFSGGAQGFWVRNGRKVYPVKNLTIASTAEEMLNGIDMVGNDLDLNRTLTAPTFRVKSMQIGGE